MPKQNDSQQDPKPEPLNQIDSGAAGAQHNDWGQGQMGEGGNAQSSAGGNIGGVPGGQHNDWGHSPVDTGVSGQASAAAARKRQGVMPGEEMGHVPRGPGGAGPRRS